MNKLIVVTGGTKGIGKAIIAKFASEGFDIVTCSRNENDLTTLATDLMKKHPSIRVFTVKADMSKKPEVDTFCKYVTSLSRNIEVLVNNAGYFIPGVLASEPEGTLEKMIEGNLYSAYHTTRGLIASMKKVQAGHIFNMCSIASIKAYPNGGSYAISKFALLGFSKCLREELKADNIRVTAVMPGATLTASWEGVELPEDRFMKPEDVADTVFFTYQLSGRSVVEEIVIRPQLGDI